MKIKSISLISVLTLLAGATSANAGAMADFYIGGMFGAGGQTLFVSDNNKTDSSTLFGANLGIDIPLLRLEAEYNHLNSSDLHTNTGMVNAMFKVPSTLIQPYFGVGAGIVFDGKHTIAQNIEQKIDTTAAYQAMLGATIDILALPIKFDIEGHALYAPNIYKIEATNTTPDMLQYDVRLKVRFIF